MKQFLTVLLFALLTPVLSAQGAFLGVELDSDTALQSATVHTVQDRSAASLMGLQAGDVILAVDGTSVDSSASLVALVGSRLPGEIVDLKIRRGQEEVTLTGVLGRQPGHQPLVLTYPDWGLPGGMHQEGFPDNFVPFSRILPPDQSGLELAPWFVPLEEFVPGAVAPWILPESFDLTEQLLLPSDIKVFELPEVSLPKPAVERDVLLIYPESTSAERRQALLEEAKAQYGDDVEVRFEGTATQIRIQTRSQSSLGTHEQQPVDSEELREQEGELQQVKTVPVPLPPKSEREF